LIDGYLSLREYDPGVARPGVEADLQSREASGRERPVLAVAKTYDQPPLIIDAGLILPIVWAGLSQVGHVVPDLPIDL
jgi:hypothetical protein